MSDQPHSIHRDLVLSYRDHHAAIPIECSGLSWTHPIRNIHGQRRLQMTNWLIRAGSRAWGKVEGPAAPFLGRQLRCLSSITSFTRRRGSHQYFNPVNPTRSSYRERPPKSGRKLGVICQHPDCSEVHVEMFLGFACIQLPASSRQQRA